MCYYFDFSLYDFNVAWRIIHDRRHCFFFELLCNVLLGALKAAVGRSEIFWLLVHTYAWLFGGDVFIMTRQDEAAAAGQRIHDSATCFAYNHSPRSRKQNRKFQFLYFILWPEWNERERAAKRDRVRVVSSILEKIWKLKFLTLFRARWQSDCCCCCYTMIAHSLRLEWQAWKDEMVVDSRELIWIVGRIF